MISDRSPYQVMLTSAFALYSLAGVLVFTSVTSPGSVLRTFPEPWARVFLALGLVTCLVVLGGTALRDRARGLLIERAGLFGNGSVCIAYAFWSFGNSGLAALGFGLMLLALGGSAAWRVIQINRAVAAARLTAGRS